ncbi:uncharacterized protein LOC117678220 isoform X4 [Pantherophis guttatus]|uniref:Uncharacterized protein LOC117678220 isoform X4 n=1 Tax=Pantherophis guttatus TaxID=94885 RepID=A0ABM3YSF2_PANGU|nr:uncharacterized protein LOC117678220 isoform X4 [Pantherophis guttatus]
MGCLDIGESPPVARKDGRVSLPSSSSGICSATSILGRSATWPTSALLARRRRRRRLHTAPPAPKLQARPVPARNPSPRAPFPAPPLPFASWPEERRGAAARKGWARAIARRRKRALDANQSSGSWRLGKKNAARRTRRASPRLLPSHRGGAARFQGRARGSRRGGRDERGEPIARSPPLNRRMHGGLLLVPSLLLSFGEGKVGLEVSGICGRRGHLSSPRLSCILFFFPSLSEAKIIIFFFKKKNGMGGRVCRATVMEAEQGEGGKMLEPVSFLLSQSLSRAGAKWLSGVGKERAFPDGCKKTGLATGKRRKPRELRSWTIWWHLSSWRAPSHPIPPALRFGSDLLIFLPGAEGSTFLSSFSPPQPWKHVKMAIPEILFCASWRTLMTVTCFQNLTSLRGCIGIYGKSSFLFNS